MTSSTSGASPHCSRISERASDGGQSRGARGPVGRPLELLAAMDVAGAVAARTERLDATTVVPFAVWRSRAANPARASAPSAVSM